ncbi:MAG TPA: hypothetical protein VK123_10655 [Candidatus Limnocylindrales bacterium]|nr:hypothetical protein [Candidatus Limnocylindrales bacterium]
MKRILMIAAALASLAFAVAPSTTQAATSVGFSVRIGDPYRGTSIRFQSEPDLVLVPRSHVYYVRDYDRDIYRYGGAWYFVEDGYWYRARSYRGPFYRVDFRFVPREVYMVPTGYRRHWGGSYGYYGGRQTWYRDSEYRGYRMRDRYGNYRDRSNQDSYNRDPYNRDRVYQNQDPRYQNQDPRYRNQDPRYQGQDPRDRNQDPRYRDNGAGSGSRDQTQDRNRSDVRNSFPDQNNNGVDDRTENQNQDRGQGRSHGNNGRHNGHGNRQDNGNGNGRGNGGN